MLQCDLLGIGGEWTQFRKIMNVFISVASFHPDYGGPARSVSSLATALAEIGFNVGVWAPDQSAAGTTFLGDGSGVRRLQGNEVTALAQFGTVDLIHDNGIWLPHNHRLASLARNRKIPRVVSIRGMLEPWALNHKRWKKQLAWLAYQKRDLRSARILHATAASEARHIKNAGIDLPIHVISNGVSVPPVSLPKPSGQQTALFLGRVHSKKGLPLLVEAWKRVKPPGWCMRVVGPDEEGHRAVLQDLVERAGLGKEWTFLGPLEGTAKRQAFEDASLFILPTHSENFGIAVAEALAHGLPVLTTEGAPWEGLKSEGCGWWTSVTTEGIAGALAEATSLPECRLREMGMRGREWMLKAFSWPSIARDIHEMYEAAVG